jgi:hypothetical protein
VVNKKFKKNKESDSFQTLWKTIWKLIVVFVGMLGVRLDRKKTLFIWIPLVILSYLLNQLVYINNWWPAYVIFGWTFYYVGNSLILGIPIRSWMIKKFGGQKAYAIYEVILGLMFMNSGFAIAQFIAAHQNTLNISPILIWIIVPIIFIFSFGTKFWSTWLVGLDIYYYKDLFLNQKSKFISTGPYKIFSNPMYGVGGIYGYLPAIIMQSWEGLIFMALCHTSIYLFYYLIEKPFIVRMYG